MPPVNVQPRVILQVDFEVQQGELAKLEDLRKEVELHRAARAALEAKLAASEERNQHGQSLLQLSREGESALLLKTQAACNAKIKEIHVTLNQTSQELLALKEQSVSMAKAHRKELLQHKRQRCEKAEARADKKVKKVKRAHIKELQQQRDVLAQTVAELRDARAAHTETT